MILQYLLKHPIFKLSLSKQAAVVFIPALLLLPSQPYPLFRGQLILLIRFFISLLYIKPVVSINKQFSIDSFLDREGY